MSTGMVSADMALFPETTVLLVAWSQNPESTTDKTMYLKIPGFHQYLHMYLCLLTQILSALIAFHS